MSCREISADLSAFLDGELDKNRMQEIQSHLSGCAECCETLDMIKSASSAFKAYTPAGVSPEFNSVRIEAPAGRKFRSSKLWRRAAAPIALAASFSLIFLWGQRPVTGPDITEQLLAMGINQPAENLVLVPNTYCLDPDDTSPQFGLNVGH